MYICISSPHCNIAIWMQINIESIGISRLIDMYLLYGHRMYGSDCIHRSIQFICFRDWLQFDFAQRSLVSAKHWRTQLDVHGRSCRLGRRPSTVHSPPVSRRWYPVANERPVSKDDDVRDVRKRMRGKPLTRRRVMAHLRIPRSLACAVFSKLNL